MGGSAGGFTVLLVAAQASRSGRTAVVALYPGHRSRRPRGDDAPVRVGLPPAPRRPAARRRGRATATARRSRTPARSARRCCCCTAPTTRPCPPRSRQRSPTRCGARARRSSGTCTKARATAGAGPRRSPTSSTAIDAFLHALGAAASSRRRASEYQGPKRGADRAVLLAHGAGADMHAAALDDRRRRARRRARSRRCASTSRTRRAGRRAPDRPPVLEAAVREAAAELLGAAEGAARTARARRPVDGRPHLLDGRRRRRRSVPRSGSCCSAIRCTRRASRRSCASSTSRDLTMPVLFVSGTRDAFGTPAELKRHAKKIKGPVDVALDRDRRPRLQAAEVERPHRRRRAGRGRSRGGVRYVWPSVTAAESGRGVPILLLVGPGSRQ